MSYIDGYLLPLPQGKEDEYLAMARLMAGKLKDWGATRVVEAIEDDCPAGKVNDFHTAVLAEDGERTIFSFVEWPSKEARAEGWKQMEQWMQEEPQHAPPFDGKRMIYGGFKPLLDE